MNTLPLNPTLSLVALGLVIVSMIFLVIETFRRDHRLTLVTISLFVITAMIYYVKVGLNVTNAFEGATGLFDILDIFVGSMWLFNAYIGVSRYQRYKSLKQLREICDKPGEQQTE